VTRVRGRAGDRLVARGRALSARLLFLYWRWHARARLHAPIGRAPVFAILIATTVIPGARAVSVVDRVSVPAPGGDRVRTFTRADGALAAGAEDGNETSRLALPRGGFVASHAWSRDGRRIAFTRCRARNCLRPSVYVILADGSDERLVIANAGGAVWMPDQRHLLVDRADKPEHWVVSVADRSRRRYAPPALAAAPFSPRLSPDGRWLFTSRLSMADCFPVPPHLTTRGRATG
jgi:dipeptidyl aminopeptidase/acylaminoacyl peptidase